MLADAKLKNQRPGTIPHSKTFWTYLSDSPERCRNSRTIAVVSTSP